MLLTPSLIPLIILALLTLHVLLISLDAFKSYGVNLILGVVWDPPSQSYGLLPALAGTLISSFISAIIATPISVSLMFLIGDLLPKSASRILHRLVEVMGSIPTVIYGLWGSTIVAEFLRSQVYSPLYSYLGFLPLFSCEPLSGQSILTAGVVLGFSIIPFASSLLIEGYRALPVKYLEAAYSLGFYRFEAYRLLLGVMKPIIVASVLLSLSRALGETTIVTLTIGNAYLLSPCLFNPGSTISSWVVNQFESSFLYPGAFQALYSGVLLVMILALIFSYIGVSLINKWQGVIYG
ncbi:MAG: ABC transporter permease [Desulfurococcus sp.]|nr:ABC transporter permease [Desulfurococcus sp.]